MQKALFSVSDKTGLVDFARGLQNLGWEFLASGGTSLTLREARIPVIDVEEYTGSPEILGGRVKTLHPAIAGGLLARPTEKDAADLKKVNATYIDLMVCNLYPFQKTVARFDVTMDEAIENIDIGGVTLIRAAAKNFSRVTVLTDPVDYPKVLTELEKTGVVSNSTRRLLANKSFTLTTIYDSAISAYLNEGN